MMEEYTEVFVWGSDSQGQLGLGSRSSKSAQKIPKLCSFNILIEKISCGEEHAGIISQSGYVYTMGSNVDGRLGIGTRSITHSTSPCLVEVLAKYKAKDISCGWAHTVIITDKGEAFSWGLGEYGALGNGLADTQWGPAPVELPDKALEVSCGSRHTGFILNKDLKYNLFMCGAGESGQLGTGGREKELTPISVLTEDPVKQVSCGIFQTGIITITGKVYMTGGNSFGQLGLGNRKGKSCFEKVESLSGVSIKKLCCSNFTAALTEKGGIYVWGSGTFGECLVPYKLNSSTQYKDLSTGTGFAILLDHENSIYSFGGNTEGELGCDEELRLNPQLIQSLKSKQIEQIACGSKFSIALGTDILPRRLKESKSKKHTVKDLINKSFEDLKTIHNKSLQSFRVERNKNLQTIENLENNVEKFKLNVKKIDKDKEILEKENQEIYRKMEEFKVKNLDLQQQVFIYKEKLQNLQKRVDDEKFCWKKQVSKCEEQLVGNQKAIKDLLNCEILKNSQIKSELEGVKQENKVLTDTVKKYQVINGEVVEENKRMVRKFESERNKLKSELESCQNELKGIKELKVEAENREVEKSLAQVAEQKKSMEAMQSEICMLKNEIKLKTQEFHTEKSKLDQELNTMSSKYTAILQETQNNSEKSHQLLLLTNTSLTKDLHDSKAQQEKLKSENDSLISQLSSMKQQKFSLKSNKDSIIHDLSSKLSHCESEKLALISQLTQKSEQIQDLTLTISSLKSENSDLSTQLSQKTDEFQSLSIAISLNDKEKSDLLIQLSSKSKEIQELELKSSKFMHENNFLKQSLSEIRQELDENKENKGNLSVKCERLTKENRDLRSQISEMEGKNREIFSNLEKDLASKARVYKERTITLLNGARSTAMLSQGYGTENMERSKSPLLHPEGNAAASLLTALDKSPGQGRSSTPSKDSVKARISELLRDKTEIEAQLSRCEL